MVRKFTVIHLLLLVSLSTTGQALEIAHPLEETPHLPHHDHWGTVYHDPLPCDSDDHAPHLCLHSQSIITSSLPLSISFLSLSQGTTLSTLGAPRAFSLTGFPPPAALPAPDPSHFF